MLPRPLSTEIENIHRLPLAAGVKR